MYLEYKHGNIVGEGIYGEGQLLSAGDDLFFWVSNLRLARLKLQFQSGTPFFKSLDPPLSGDVFAFMLNVLEGESLSLDTVYVMSYMQH